MFCTSCGGQVKDGAKFCIYCGAPLAKAKKIEYVEADPFQQQDPWNDPIADSSISGGSIPDTEMASSGLLVLQDTKDGDKIYACDLGTAAVLGRDAASCTMVIEGERSVSRRHCSFYRRGNACYVEDLQSFNHTYLNGTEVNSPMEIHVGDRLTLGALELIVVECDLSQ
ncbi:MAG: FHA domain-containing protein [Lachnospiraceae bacterium]|nr:FHA domain-containing protein [Lachnospiraceae bacterium]